MAHKRHWSASVPLFFCGCLTTNKYPSYGAEHVRFYRSQQTLFMSLTPNRNYSAPIVGIVLLLATGLYLAWGRREYFGPLIQVAGVTVNAPTATEAETVSDKKDIAS